MDKGTLLISLDFELFWGVLDCHTYDSYGKNVLGGRNAIPKLLELFKKYGVHATWATVGMMFADNVEDLFTYCPSKKLYPHYKNQLLSSYNFLEKETIKIDDENYFFGRQLIDLISKYDGQEIGSHTFSHYYAREDGQNIDEFSADINSAKNIAENKGYEVNTLVFPRNQSLDSYEKVIKSDKFIAYRGEEKDWIHRIPVNIIKRMFRLMDSYINLTGSSTYPKEIFKKGELHNFRGSRFLRPYNKRLSFIEPLKIHRVKSQMKKAAKKGEIMHLWWHPHNVGLNTEVNLKHIEEILSYYKKLNTKYGMKSCNMRELANEINER